MVRSMYSGVAGMRANQNRMDVIGNNIANANTYGFKSGRATFRDIYYQTYRGASEGTISRGGINPSNIGYGAQLASIDLMMDSASMTSTGFALDCAITGEGFFQVMDPDGNIYYTKAGMLDIDPATGAVIDSNGNFVLGTSATNGKLDSTHPSQEKIIIQLDSVSASTAKVTKEVGGRTLTIESTGQNKDANISFTFSKSSEMPDGQKVRIVREGTSSVYNVQLNANEYFKDMGELQDLINDAITENYGGSHPGYPYKFSIDPNPWDAAQEAYDASKGPTDPDFKGLTGAELVDTPTAEREGGGLELTANGGVPQGFNFVGVGTGFSGMGDSKLTFKFLNVGDTDADGNPVEEACIQVTVTTTGSETGAADSHEYVGYIKQSRLESGGGGTVLLQYNGSNTDTITIRYPSSKTDVLSYDTNGDPTGLSDVLRNAATNDAANGSSSADANNAEFGLWAKSTANSPTKKCGWGKATFTLEGGTEFHTQDLTNITGISIGADGVISGTTENGLTVLGRIDLATFANSKGLDQIGSSYFAESANSGPVKLAIAGEDGTGAIKNSSLEMSNVDLAQEFSDMIVTQRGFQASSRMITVSDTMLEELTNLKR